jgi:hypothetical protein
VEAIDKGVIITKLSESYIVQDVMGQFVVSVLLKKISHVEVPDQAYIISEDIDASYVREVVRVEVGAVRTVLHVN